MLPRLLRVLRRLLLNALPLSVPHYDRMTLTSEKVPQADNIMELSLPLPAYLWNLVSQLRGFPEFNNRESYTNTTNSI